MAVSNPRTSPTVKPSSALNRRALRSWELRLGTLQALLVSLALVACVTVSFFIGLFSGRRAGLETALQRNQTSVSRVPISASQEMDAEKKSDQIVSDVYRTLQDRSDHAPVNANPNLAEEEMPELAKIETSQDISNLTATKSELPKIAEKLDTNALEPLDKLPPPQGRQAGTTKEIAAINGSEIAQANSKSESGAKLGNLRADNLDAKAEIGGDTTHIQSRLLDDPNRAGLGNAQLGAQQKNDIVAEPALKLEAESEINKTAASTAVLDSARLPKGWFAQVAAPKKREDAETIARQLKGSGFKVVIESALVRGESYFRILVGPESNREQAERLIQQLKRESYIKSDPFTRMVR